MKTIIIFVVLITIFSQVGCKQATQSTLPDIYVSFDIESAFQNDSVKFTLDDKTLLESRITTNYSISLAWSSGLQQLTRDSHRLNFAVVEHGVQKDYNIDTANDTSTVFLNFNKSTKQISAQQIKGRFYRR